jgi:hypothetical protein
MFSTWDRYRTGAAAWHREAKQAPQPERPLSHFLSQVDHLFYAAAAAFAICVIVLAAT